MAELLNITDVCKEIFAGGDAPKDGISDVRTIEFPYPIFSNGEANDGLYGYARHARVFEPSVTVSARGTIGFAAVRDEPFDTRQIYFVNQIVEYVVHNGLLKDMSVLQSSPFTDQGSVVDIFPDLSVWQGIRAVIKQINANAGVA